MNRVNPKDGGGPRVDAEAAKWCQKVAAREYCWIRSLLEEVFGTGEVVPKNVAEAAQWYYLATEHGDAKAQLLLGAMNAGEDGEEGLIWVLKSADQGYTEAYYLLGRLYKPNSPPSSVPKDLKESIKWMRKAADLGHALAQYHLGTLYDGRDLVLKDDAECAKWYLKAAEGGYAMAQYMLSAKYMDGLGVPQNTELGWIWMRKAADQGFRYAQSYLGRKYWEGSGLPKDAAEAVKWYRKAAEQGDSSAQYQLSVMHWKGDGVQKDTAEAEKWFRKLSANRECALSMLRRLRDILTRKPEDESNYKQMNEAEKSALYSRLMKHYKPSKGVLLEASWCNDEIIVRVRLTSKEWKVIVSGDSFEKKGTSYSYEGERFTTDWSFNYSDLGSVTVSYSSRRQSGESGEGYEGSVEDLIQ